LNKGFLTIDARCFVGKNDYPTLQGLQDFVLKSRPGFAFYVKDDIISAHYGEAI
jgi:hypothetical protein